MKVTVTHQLLNSGFFIPTWPVKHLFLGTFNPEGGERVPYFYGRPKNQTWKLLSEIFGVSFDPNDPSFLDQIEQHGIACMDMITSIEVDDSQRKQVLGKGYSDSKIINKRVERSYNTDAILKVIKNNPGVSVYSTWGNGPTLKDWQRQTSRINNMVNLVSPSLVARVPEGSDKFDWMLQDWISKIFP